MLTARFNLSNQLVKECEQALDESFQKAKTWFDAHSTPNKLSLGDVVYVETSQRGLLHHKFADRFKGPYKIISFLENSNVQLTPLGTGRPITSHINNCKQAVVRFSHLELPQDKLPLNDSISSPAPNYWDYEPSSELNDNHETYLDTNSTEADPSNPSAHPAEDSSLDDAT